jgi:hypothetical protein
MLFPTSDKIIRRAAKRLAILETQDNLGQDPWEDPKNREMIEAFCTFLTNCSKREIRRIVALSNVSLDYAFECIYTVLENAGIDWPFNGPSDLGQNPNQLSLSL